MKRSLLACVVVSFVAPLSALATSGCKKEPEAPAVVPASERVRPIDLPSSRRSTDRLGAAALPVLIAFDAIAVDDRDVVPLTRGALPAGIGDAASIPALAAVVPAGRSEALIRMHSATKYATMIAVIATLREKGVQRIGFEVRTDSLGTDTGVLVPASVDVRPASSEPFAFPEPFGRPWDVLTESWDDAYVACSGSPGSFDCSAVSENIAYGGDGDIAIFHRGNGVILDLRRHNVGAQAGAADDRELMVGRNGRAVRRATDAAPPANHASFGFRWQSTAAEPEAPLATVMKAIANGAPLGVRMSADPPSDAGAAISLIGSTFPNGVAAPVLLLDAERR